MHKSELDEFMLGEIALGGGEFTVVFVFPVVDTVLLLVDCVTIGSACTTELHRNTPMTVSYTHLTLPTKA